jgi:putative oxidoreductase|tara:strand:- start:128 stop:526 length:399 start_codon:yes stop_codon:yes gene_type:complete
LKSALTHTGRTLLALYFLLPGILKFVSWDMHIMLMETHDMLMVPVLLALTGIIQIGASICLIVNKQVVISALGLAVVVLLINVNLHDFWNVYEGVDAKHETQNFVKNMGIFAGLLLLAAMNMGKASTAEMEK